MTDWATLYVFMLASFLWLVAVRRVSRLLHPQPSIPNAISAVAVVGAILVAGGDHPSQIRALGAIAFLAWMTAIVSGFLLPNLTVDADAISRLLGKQLRSLGRTVLDARSGSTRSA